MGRFSAAKELAQELRLTFLDHLGQVGLGKDLSHSKYHERILGADKVCTESTIQEAHQQLGVHQQVFLDEGCPGHRWQDGARWSKTMV